MSKTTKIISLLIIWFISIFFLVKTPILPDLEYINKLFEISIVVSSILFGVLGIWLSSIYGESIKILFQNIADIDSSSIINEIKRLFYPLFFSFFSISISLLFFCLQIFKSNLEFISINKTILKIIVLSVFNGITLLQICYLSLIFSPLLKVLKKLFFKEDLEKNKKDLFG
ncbi:hypothetical protein [Algoriphagus mannitolivorans]|uniref:hypothetical protein n=1 Tax=Algoriphagus mannitolivorans TaxID=226504 RepID=UPI00047A9BBF|nr:hypothetical protein [Algoriphagus mannitolivorans]